MLNTVPETADGRPAARKTVHVAVGVIVRDGRVLIARRPDTAHQGGLLEFCKVSDELGPRRLVLWRLLADGLESISGAKFVLPAPPECSKICIFDKKQWFLQDSQSQVSMAACWSSAAALGQLWIPTCTI